MILAPPISRQPKRKEKTMASVADDFCPIAAGDMGPWFVPESLDWLHGWPRISVTVVLMGTGLHCIGCGKCHGITPVAYRGETPFPDKTPEWPFKEGACPICNLEKQVFDLRDAT